MEVVIEIIKESFIISMVVAFGNRKGYFRT